MLLREGWVRGERARVVFVTDKNKGYSRKEEAASRTLIKKKSRRSWQSIYEGDPGGRVKAVEL